MAVARHEDRLNFRLGSVDPVFFHVVWEGSVERLAIPVRGRHPTLAPTRPGTIRRVRRLLHPDVEEPRSRLPGKAVQGDAAGTAGNGLRISVSGARHEPAISGGAAASPFAARRLRPIAV